MYSLALFLFPGIVQHCMMGSKVVLKSGMSMYFVILTILHILLDGQSQSSLEGKSATSALSLPEIRHLFFFFFASLAREGKK